MRGAISDEANPRLAANMSCPRADAVRARLLREALAMTSKIPLLRGVAAPRGRGV